MDYADRCAGSMVGLAVGDALGFPVEFLNRTEITAQFGAGGVTDFERTWGHDQAGIYSDDTQMTMAVARALLAADLDSLDDIMARVREQFIEWADSPANDRAPGQTCMDGARKMKRGVHWFAAGDPYSKGCGAAMRVAPIGLVFATQPERLVEVSRAVSICTHGHPTALASGIAAAAAVAYLAAGHPPGHLLESIARTLRQSRGEADYEEVVSHDPLGEQLKKLEVVEASLALPPEQAFDQLGGGWIGEEAVAGALYAFLRSPEDFSETVLVAANACKTDEQAYGKGRCDSDSIACIAGSFAGAHLGIAAIPEKWRREVEDGAELEELGRALAKAKR